MRLREWPSTNTGPSPGNDMTVNVLKRKNIDTKQIETFVTWFMDNYIKDDRVSIVVDLKRCEANGFCYCPLASDSIISIVIELEKAIASSMDELLVYLSHELWHARQYAKGFLQDTDDECVSIWKGKMVDSTTMSYKNLPWEKDAFRNQNKVYQAWKEAN